MDPVALIVTALAEGTALEPQDTAATAVQDAYTTLWARVRKRLADHPDGAMVLARHAEAPQTWEAPLSAALAAAGARCDADLISAATTLLRLADEPGFRSGKYAVDAQSARSAQTAPGAQGSPARQIGDHSPRRNSLNGQPGY